MQGGTAVADSSAEELGAAATPAGVEVSSSRTLESAIAASGVRVFAFDFDMTLLRIHAYSSRIKAADVPTRWRDDVPYPEELSAILRTINNLGHEWHVVTFGQPPVVSAYMDALGFSQGRSYRIYSPLAGDQVYGRSLGPPPKDKNELLEKCAREAATSGGVENGQVLLLDDDSTNVEEARRVGFLGAHVKPGEGISTALFTQYLEQAVQEAEYQKQVASERAVVYGSFIHLCSSQGYLGTKQSGGNDWNANDSSVAYYNTSDDDATIWQIVPANFEVPRGAAAEHLLKQKLITPLDTERAVADGDLVFLVSQDGTQNTFLYCGGGGGATWTSPRMHSDPYDRGSTRKWRVSFRGKHLTPGADCQFCNMYPGEGMKGIMGDSFAVEECTRTPSQSHKDVFRGQDSIAEQEGSMVDIGRKTNFDNKRAQQRASPGESCCTLS